MSDSIGIYLNEIGKVALLNAEDERDLSKAIEAGREARKRHEKGERSAAIRADIRNAARAKDRFIRSNLRHRQNLGAMPRAKLPNDHQEFESNLLFGQAHDQLLDESRKLHMSKT